MITSTERMRVMAGVLKAATWLQNRGKGEMDGITIFHENGSVCAIDYRPQLAYRYQPWLATFSRPGLGETTSRFATRELAIHYAVSNHYEHFGS